MQVIPPYAFYGGAMTLSYQLIHDYLTHHETNGDRPSALNHWIATTIIGTTTSIILKGSLTSAAFGFIVSFFLLSPMTLWL